MKRLHEGGIFFLVLVFWALIPSCGERHRVVENSFYYWQRQFKIDQDEKQLLDSLNVRMLYVKFFDVDWDDAAHLPLPKAPISFADTSYRLFEVVPVVYITGRALDLCPEANIAALADSISQKIKRTEGVFHIRVQEVQMDCDWTVATKNKYFEMLREVKKQMPESQLSCTIRLHQVKYRQKTGVPPVDRGMLMFYNMGRVEEAHETNSIYDAARAGQYVSYMHDYPLPLDAVLPVFSWGVRYTDGYPRELLNGLTANDLKGNNRFHPEGNNWYRVDSAGFLHGYYLRGQDRIRLEEIDPALCKKAAQQLSDHLGTTNFTLAFFDLQSKNTRRYALADFQEICRLFR